MTKVLLAISGMTGLMAASAQDASDIELARLLASDSTRAATVSKIVASGRAKVPLLLSWARNPPPQIEEPSLYVGLAEVFGRLKTAEAIPFLIENIGLERWPASPNTWMKTARVIEERMPAVAALVQIGPAASRALIHTPTQGMTPEQRLASIFVVSRIRNVPEARNFLTSVLGRANIERHWAEEGLKALEH